MEIDLKNVKVKAFKSMNLKVWSIDPWDSPKPFHGVHKVKTIFVIIQDIICLLAMFILALTE
jgi:hypothetical protein